MSELLPWMAPYSGWFVIALIACVGLTVAARGMRRRPVPGPAGRCARCGYDLTGAPTLTCSECGHRCQADGQSFVLRRRPFMVLAGLAIAMALPAFVVQRRVNEHGWTYYLKVGPGYWVSPDKELYRAVSGPYLVRITEDRRRYHYGSRYSDQRCTITRDGVVVWSASDWYLEPGMGDGANNRDDPPTGLGPLADVDGDGSPEFLCTGFDGGNSGRSRLCIVSLASDSIHPILDAQDGAYDNIYGARDLDGDGTFEFIAWERTYVLTPGPDWEYTHTVYRLRDRLLVPDVDQTLLLPDGLTFPAPPDTLRNSR